MDAVSALDSEFIEISDFTDDLNEVTLGVSSFGGSRSPNLSASPASHKQHSRKISSGWEGLSAANKPTLPEGYIAFPEYPVFKGDPPNKPHTSVLVKQTTMLLMTLGPQYLLSFVFFSSFFAALMQTPFFLAFKGFGNYSTPLQIPQL